ncbi:MAG: hypothetical protein A4E27_00372 [Methanobacterium sp. PtaU1.Bin242]|jgi:hypothetical protein|nr:MAG: hypothetical protein A4E27_00372 [Methanobacterium sp. PtaU1.Bin242]
MMMVSIVRRRLKEHKTYEDFRRVWYHTIGFGMSDASEKPKPPLGNLYTVINAFDPREIIVIGFGPEITEDDLRSVLNIDVKDRLDNPLDDVIEPEIGRSFGVLVSEDDFSPAGALEYKDPSVSGLETDLDQTDEMLSLVKREIERASAKRDEAKKV